PVSVSLDGALASESPDQLIRAWRQVRFGLYLIQLVQWCWVVLLAIWFLVFLHLFLGLACFQDATFTCWVHADLVGVLFPLGVVVLVLALVVEVIGHGYTLALPRAVGGGSGRELLVFLFAILNLTPCVVGQALYLVKALFFLGLLARLDVESD